MWGNWAFGHLLPLSYDLIAFDGPWDFESYSAKGETKGPRAQYDCLSVEDVCRQFPVDQLAGGDCLLLCWATQPLLDRQIECVKKWGFVYKSLIVWEKRTRNDKVAMGPGYRVRLMCEFIIVATIGDPKHKPFPGLFRGERREHSRKPERFYELIDEKCPKLFRRADVFGRQTRPGYDVFGNEATKFDEEVV